MFSEVHGSATLRLGVLIIAPPLGRGASFFISEGTMKIYFFYLQDR